MEEKLPKYEIRLMKREEIPQIISLRHKFDLYMGTHTLDTWYEFDPEAFYVAVTSNGSVIGSCAAVILDADFAYMVMYFIKSEYQGRGLGTQIWSKVMERVCDKNIGIDSALNIVTKYRDQSGFSYECDSYLVGYISQKIPTENTIKEVAGMSTQIVKFGDCEQINAVAKYEADILGYSTTRLKSLMCRQVDSLTIAAYKEHDNSICGFGFICKNIQGNALLGPLFADNEEVAEMILYNLTKAFPVAERKGVITIIVDSNESAVTLMNKLDFKKDKKGKRLYKLRKDISSAVSFKVIHTKYKKMFALCHFSKSIISV